MPFGDRGKLFFVSVVLIAVASIVSGTFLERSLRHNLKQRIETELFKLARTSRDAVVVSTAPVDHQYAQMLAERLGNSNGTRITIINSQGQVVGDSGLRAAKLTELDNHGQRPEVRNAIRHGRGVARRRSATLQADMLYAAVRFLRADGSHGVLRVARPLNEIDDAVDQLRWMLLLAGLLGLSAALLTSVLTSHALSRKLRQVARRTRTLAGDPQSGALPMSRPAEISPALPRFDQVADELERTVSELATERTRFAKVLQTMDDAVLTIQANGYIGIINRSAANLLGVQESAAGQQLRSIVDVSALNKLVEHSQTVGPIAGELDLNGHSMHVRATPLDDGGTVLVLHDVTDVRRLETVRRDFVANVSHELRTPLSVIQANAETLLSGALDQPEQARRFVEALSRHATRLTRLVADLLDLSRIEAGQVSCDLQAIALEDAFERAVEAIERAARHKQVEVNRGNARGLMVLADAKALDQVLLNLVENAVKYTPSDGKVSVAATPAEGEVRIEVLDNGPGIASEHRHRIFERFYRVDPGRSREMGGTGLGLAIAKHLVDTMHGHIGVDPVQPHGSSFWITLPQAGQGPAC